MAELNEFTSGLDASLKSLTIHGKTAITLEKAEDDFILEISRSLDSLLLAASTTDFSIQLLSTGSMALSDKLIGHTDVVTAVKFSAKQPHLLYSSSEDYCVQCWDTRAPTRPAHTYRGTSGVHSSFLSLAVDPDDKIICAGTEKNENRDAHIMFWDSRQGGQRLLGGYSESHEDDVTTLSFAPRRADILASGGADGLVHLYDLSQKSEEDALQFTCNVEQEVASLGWCGADKTRLFSVSTGSDVHVWDSLEGGLIKQLPAPSRQAGQDYVLGCFESNDAPGTLYVMTGDHKGDLRLCTVGSDALQEVTTLSEGGHTDTVRCCLWDTVERMMFTGGEDGMICAWRPTDPACVTPSDPSKKRGTKRSKVSTTPSADPGCVTPPEPVSVTPSDPSGKLRRANFAKHQKALRLARKASAKRSKPY